jgi:hypothetical protein
MCARARPEAPENHGQRERREKQGKGKEGSKARAWHHSISKCPFPCVLLRADPPADPSCLSLPLPGLVKLISLLFFCVLSLLPLSDVSNREEH